MVGPSSFFDCLIFAILDGICFASYSSSRLFAFSLLVPWRFYGLLSRLLTLIPVLCSIFFLWQKNSVAKKRDFFVPSRPSLQILHDCRLMFDPSNMQQKKCRCSYTYTHKPMHFVSCCCGCPEWMPIAMRMMRIKRQAHNNFAQFMFMVSHKKAPASFVFFYIYYVRPNKASKAYYIAAVLCAIRIFSNAWPLSLYCSWMKPSNILLIMVPFI